MSSKFFLLLVVLFSSGCSYSTFYVPVERLVYPPTSPSGIAISTQKTVHRAHKILGRVAVTTWGGGDSARSALQNEAAKIGASLIIDLRLERAIGKTSSSGLAVMLLGERK